MTSNIDTAKMLQQFMLRLKNSNPASWDDFVQTFDIYATEVTVQMTQAPSEEILRMQGRAQQMIALLRLMRECALVKTPPAPPAPVNPNPQP
jgi:hypothetical protein